MTRFNPKTGLLIAVALFIFGIALKYIWGGTESVDPQLPDLNPSAIGDAKGTTILVLYICAGLLGAYSIIKLLTQSSKHKS